MSPGMYARVRRPAARRRRRPIHVDGGCTFAEHPDRGALVARVIWHADIDPGTLGVAAAPADPADPERVHLDGLAPWLTVALDVDGQEHAVLSDGWRHIRLDIEQGRLTGERAVVLQYRLAGLGSAERRLLPLQRLLALFRHRRFLKSLFPRDSLIARGIAMLRVHDALADGASQRDIAAALFGEARARRDWNNTSDSLRSRTRRLVREARVMGAGG